MTGIIIEVKNGLDTNIELFKKAIEKNKTLKTITGKKPEWIDNKRIICYTERNDIKTLCYNIIKKALCRFNVSLSIVYINEYSKKNNSRITVSNDMIRVTTRCTRLTKAEVKDYKQLLFNKEA